MVADDAIRWLVEDPRRFCLGYLGEDEPWKLARDLIRAHAGTCSHEAYSALESALLRYYPEMERRHFRYILEERWIPSEPSSRQMGFLQHALLPALPAERRTARAVNQVGQLDRKFARPADDFPRNGPHGGGVSSPIASRTSRLSD